MSYIKKCICLKEKESMFFLSSGSSVNPVNSMATQSYIATTEGSSGAVGMYAGSNR